MVSITNIERFKSYGKKLSLVSLTYVSENNKKNLKLEKLNGISSLEIVESTKDV